MKFPFEFRTSQRDLMGAVYKTMKDNSILYAIAPTGTGKTAPAEFALNYFQNISLDSLINVFY